MNWPARPFGRPMGLNQAHEVHLQAVDRRRARPRSCAGTAWSTAAGTGLLAGDPRQQFGVGDVEQPLVVVEFVVGQACRSWRRRSCRGSGPSRACRDARSGTAACAGAGPALRSMRVVPVICAQSLHRRAAHIAWIGGRVSAFAAVGNIAAHELRHHAPIPARSRCFRPITSLAGVGPKVGRADRKGRAGRSRRPRRARRRPAVRAAQLASSTGATGRASRFAAEGAIVTLDVRIDRHQPPPRGNRSRALPRLCP